MTPAGFDQIFAFFFRPKGRISRREFVLGVVLLLLVDLALFTFLVARATPEPGLVTIMILAGLPLSVALLVLVAKRCHDLGLPGSFLLLLIVPAVNVLWLLVLAFRRGSPGPNAYGPPPRFRPD